MISILMPIFNGVEYFKESYESILSQTYKNWELLIGINGHELNSDVYKNIKNIVNDNRIKIHQFDDIKSKSLTLNKLVKYCSNEIICILDVDDKWHSNKLELQLPYMVDFDVVGTNCAYFGDKTGNPYLVFEKIEKNIFQQFNPIINSSSMFLKKDAYWDDNLDGVEDYDMWLRLNYQDKTFFNIKQVLCYHRIHKTSAFNTKNFSLNIKKMKHKWNK